MEVTRAPSSTCCFHGGSNRRGHFPESQQPHVLYVALPLLLSTEVNMGLNPASMGLLVYESDVECMTLTLIDLMCYNPVGRPIPSHGILWDVPRHITAHHRTCYRAIASHGML